MTINVDLRHAVYALSDALDLVGVDDVAHGKRVGLMAAECARALGLSSDEVAFLFDLGLLHDIGVSSTQTHQHLVSEFDWSSSQVHAEVGHKLLAGFAPLADMALPVKYHHTPWDKLVTLCSDPDLCRKANLIFLVDRVDALTAPYYASNSVLLHTEEIRAAIAQHAGSYFDPALVSVFMDVSRTEAFWLLLEPRSVQAYQQDMLATSRATPISRQALRQLAEIFSRIVDAKSPFTATHSLGVAHLARYLARQMQVSEERCDQLEIAGLLHDLGKLRVPDEILEKPAKLDKTERAIINAHSFETFQILRNIEGFQEIAHWAAYHHEEPDGTGYPFHLLEKDMPLEARILRVADIFQAMVQNRPYRKGLNETEVMQFMWHLVSEGRIQEDIVQVLAQHIHEAIRVATPEIPA
ncbi:HD-GYP domain-containing protein [Leeia oryzae]|uniref:HD-GYP domain-containing protein n=1 Tax=Leeia oryzae TaxID=356662 RepID=UPI00036C2B2A|nr:HD domain-containing phosphohydrolase [Leeia oryzae]